MTYKRSQEVGNVEKGIDIMNAVSSGQCTAQLEFVHSIARVVKITSILRGNFAPNKSYKPDLE